MINLTPSDLVDTESIARIQFYSTEKVSADSDTVAVWTDAARCSEVYAKEIAIDTFFAQEFSDPSWICPSTRNITIYNNPFLFDTGRNFVMVVNDCNVAEAIDTENGLTSYTTTTCLETTTA